MALVGRSIEMQQLEGLLDDVAAARSRKLVIHGPAGIGKTSLLTWVTATARGRGFQVVGATGVPASDDPDVANLALQAVLDPFADLVDGLDPPFRTSLRHVLGTERVPAAVTFVHLATHAVLRVAAANSPVLVTIDDADRIDQSSLRALVLAAYLSRSQRVGFIFTSRLQLPDVDVEGLPLAGLELPAAVELLSAAVPDATVAEGLWRGAEGNPRVLLHNTSRPTARPPLVSIPDDDVAAHAAPFLALPAASQNALGVAALELDDDENVVRAALERIGCSVGDLSGPGLDALIRRRDGRIRWQRALVRSAIAQVIGDEHRRRLHRALAEPVTQAQRWDQAIWHLTESAEGPDDDVAADLVGVAERAVDGGRRDLAAMAREKAADLATSDERRDDHLEQAAELRFGGGDVLIAVQTVERLLARARDPLVRGRIAILLGQAEMWARGPTTATRTFTTHAAVLRDQAPPLAATLLLHASAARLLALDPVRAADLVRDAVPLAAGSPVMFAADAAQQLTRLFCGSRIDLKKLHELEETAREALRMAGPVADPIIQMCGWARLLRGDWDRATDLFSLVIGVAEEEGMVGRSVLARILRADIQWRTGQWDECLREIDDTLAKQRDSGLEPWIPCTLAALARMEAASKRFAQCEGHALLAIEIGSALGIKQVHAWGLSALGLLALGQGEWGKAHTAFEQLAAVAGEVPEPGWLWWQADAIEAAFRAGHPHEAKDAFDRLRRQAISTRRTWALAAVRRTGALLGRYDDPEKQLRTAITRFRQVGSPFEEGRTSLALARHLYDENRRSEAATEAATAKSIFLRLQADPWVVQAGMIGAFHSSPVFTRLTPKQREVLLTLAADGGLSDDEIARRLRTKPRTVRYHMERLRSLTGMTTRTQLVSAVLNDPVLRDQVPHTVRKSST